MKEFNNEAEVMDSIYNIDDYIRKVVIQAYENITEREYSEEDLHIVIFVAGNNVFINWKVNRYNAEVYKIAIKVRFRLRNNYSKHFCGNTVIFTKHTLECNEQMKNDIIQSKNVYITENCSKEALIECLGKQVYDEIEPRIEVVPKK